MEDNTESICLIVPAVVVDNLDPHTGIPFMPHMAAYLAAEISKLNYKLQIFDLFGLDSHERKIDGNFMIVGASEKKIVKEINIKTKIAFVYCRTIEDLYSTELICKELIKVRPNIKVCLFENIQTVNSFSLKEIISEYLDIGVTLGIMGEPERRIGSIISELSGKSPQLSEIPGIAFRNQDGNTIITNDEPFNKELDLLTFPLWEEFPLSGYWEAGFAHAPIGKEKFLPLLTSRGCPYRCTFCVSPAINPEWRSHSAKYVVDLMEYHYHKLGVTDFHISDLDPTISDKRTQSISNEIISRNLKVTWKLAQGTKIETIKSEKTLELMAQSGCTFISFSPETGSEKLLKIMNKRFNQEYALKLVRKMNQLQIKTQACFIAGVPGEDEEDRDLSIKYVKRLVHAGIDEIAVTIFTPIPGAKLADSLKGFKHYSELTHSPRWREDYAVVNKFRIKMYLTFFMYKCLYPKKFTREIWGLLSRNFKTKMEMSVFKLMKLLLLYHFPFLYKKSNR